eukprot:scaffold23494_cov60-Phaeocystis_antarctica.AAC.3
MHTPSGAPECHRARCRGRRAGGAHSEGAVTTHTCTYCVHTYLSHATYCSRCVRRRYIRLTAYCNTYLPLTCHLRPLTTSYTPSRRRGGTCRSGGRTAPSYPYRKLRPRCASA